MKKTISFFISGIIMTSSIPLATFAADAQPSVLSKTEAVSSGNYGKNITWTLDSDGVLTLSGEGEIPDRDGITPWFYQNSNINTVIVEDGITSIGKSVFIELKAVTSVSLPEGLKSIGNGAFSECFNLKTINIPDSMESIDENAFYGCQLTELELPDNISYIGQRAFFACNIKTLKIPDKLTIIDVGTFSNCELNEVTISDNVKFINDVAFNGNSIKSVTIPESVEKVHYRAFSYCEDLEEVIFENPDTIIVDDDSTECNNLFYKIGYKGDEYYKGIFKGYRGSNAEKYAEISQLEFEALISKKAGDSNGDGRMNMSDAVLIMQSIANPDKYGVNGTDNSHITEQGQKNADTNGDGVTNLDALAIQKKLLKLE